MCAKSVQSYATLCDPVDCIPPDSSVHGILQAGILEWVAMPSSRESPWPSLVKLTQSFSNAKIIFPHSSMNQNKYVLCVHNSAGRQQHLSDLVDVGRSRGGVFLLVSERKAKDHQLKHQSPGEATALPESMVRPSLEESHSSVLLAPRAAAGRRQTPQRSGLLRPQPHITLADRHVEVLLQSPPSTWALLPAFRSFLLASPGVWMPTASAPCPPAASAACIPWGTCGWTTTHWRRSRSRLSEAYRRCRPWPWPWTKYTTYQTMPLETSPAWWFCKFCWFFSPFSNSF